MKKYVGLLRGHPAFECVKSKDWLFLLPGAYRIPPIGTTRNRMCTTGCAIYAPLFYGRLSPGDQAEVRPKEAESAGNM